MDSTRETEETMSPAVVVRRPFDPAPALASLVPASVPDRSGWALDIAAAFAALGIAPTNEHACSVLAVVEQESTYRADPSVPGLAFRSDVVTGPGGSQVVLDDPAGNPIELFQPAS